MEGLLSTGLPCLVPPSKRKSFSHTKHCKSYSSFLPSCLVNLPSYIGNTFVCHSALCIFNLFSELTFLSHKSHLIVSLLPSVFSHRSVKRILSHVHIFSHIYRNHNLSSCKLQKNFWQIYIYYFFFKWFLGCTWVHVSVKFVSCVPCVHSVQCLVCVLCTLCAVCSACGVNTVCSV